MMSHRVALGQVPLIFGEFLDKVLVPVVATESGPKSWLVRAAGVAIASSSVDLLEPAIPTMKMLGIAGDDNMIDLDRAYHIATETMKSEHLVFLNFRFDQSDLDKLKEIALKYSQENQQIEQNVHHY